MQAALIRRWQLSDDGAYTPYHPTAAIIGLFGAVVVIATLFTDAEGSDSDTVDRVR